MGFENLFDLTGKTAIMTGAAGGIGREVALGVADFGADIAVVDMNLEAAERVAEQIRQRGRRALALRVDITREDQLNEMVARVVGELGRLDILINLVGNNCRKSAFELTEQEYDTVLNVSLKGAFLLSRAVARHMVAQRKGKIVHFASVCSVLGHKDYAAYSSAKGGLSMLVKVLGHEWIGDNVNVNAVAPVTTETDFNRQWLTDNPDRKAETLSRVPAGRLGTAADLIGPVVLLSSEASNFMVGQTLYVDGGRTID